jgi:biopolymer transport protein ExbD
VRFIKKHWKNILITMLVLLLVVETALLWQIPVSFERVTPASFSQTGLQVSESYTQEPAIKLTIDYKGGFNINGMELPDNKKETLFHAMLDMIDEQGENAPLLLRIERNANYQSVATVLDVAGRLGLTNISMETEKP